MFKKISLFLSAILFLIPHLSLARENVTDWYLKDFNSRIIVNKDSTLEITEEITADCGQAVGKHGIFRILPERIKVNDGTTIKTPVELISITDFEGRPLKYTQSRNTFDKTVTWKIGDPDKTVQGENYYKIHYLVKNVIRYNNANFDELYWNLSGNFWDLEIDRFRAEIIFPSEVTKENSTVEYYTGYMDEKGKGLAKFSWSAPNVLVFDSTDMLNPKQGITASVIFPKNIFTPYQFGFLEIYGKYLWPILPLITFFICFYFWWKYGKDPKMDKTIIAEYEAPEKLTPIETGMLMNNGNFNDKLITAEIINLATKGLITIKEIEKKALLFSSKDYEFNKKPDSKLENTLTHSQKMLLEKIFEKGNMVKLSALKNKFYEHVGEIKTEAKKQLEEKGLISPSGLRFQAAFIALGIILMFSSFFLAMILFLSLAAGIFLSGLIILVFGIIMPKRTLAGAELNWKIKGFKLFMETVDKHRAEFYEKENIFEKFLPYAIVFGITGIWIKKMQEIYGEEYFSTYHPVWYAGNLGAFDADSFNSTLNSLSSGIAASTSSPSGSGGAGGAGGGGGGGGGGGW